MYRFIMSYDIDTSLVKKEINVKADNIGDATNKLLSLYDKSGANISHIEIIKIIIEV